MKNDFAAVAFLSLAAPINPNAIDSNIMSHLNAEAEITQTGGKNRKVTGVVATLSAS
jgi:hypothetical protein